MQPFELLQLRSRIDSELLHQDVASSAIRLERIRLPPRSVEREYVLRPEPFAIRLLGDRPFELGYQVVVPSERELRVVEKLERVDTAVVESRRLGLGDRLATQVGQR